MLEGARRAIASARETRPKMGSGQGLSVCAGRSADEAPPEDRQELNDLFGTIENRAEARSLGRKLGITPHTCDLTVRPPRPVWGVTEA